jgi:hypothetical protein
MTTVNEIIAQFNVARDRIYEIYAQMNDQQTAEGATLAALNSVSKTSRFNLWKYVCAFVMYIQQQLWNEAKVELTEIRESGIAANKAWFAKEWKKFQYGDALLVNDTTGKYYYAVIDATKQIIKKLAIVQGTNNWLLRVATEDGGGNSIALSGPQLVAFKEFIDLTQPAGPKVPVVSLNGDQIDVRFNVFYNPLKPVADVRALVEAAYLAYLKEIDIEGDSIYFISKHIDKLQAVADVIDVVLVSCQAKPDGGVYANVTRIYTPVSGYVIKDPALALTTAIVLTPNV